MKNRNVKVVDDHSIDRDANIMFAFDLEGSEYVIYWISRDEENNNIFVSKVIKNLDGTFNMLNIEDSMEKSTISEIVKKLISSAVNDQNGKLVGSSITLSDGKNLKLISVSFNKEQTINVQKTYITTVKRAITNVAEDYYDVFASLDTPLEVQEIFPVNPVVAELLPDVKVVEETPKEVIVPETVEERTVIEPIIPQGETTVSTPTVEINDEKLNDEFVAFGVESTLPTSVESAVAEPANVADNNQFVGTVVESITVAEPAPTELLKTVDEVQPKPVEVPEVAPVIVPPFEPTPVVSPAVVTTPVDTGAPLVFNAAKETNLNAALGEVAKEATIPVENIESVREFGVDTPVPTTVTAQQVVQPAATDSKSGFANSKFFMVVAVAFFLASCIFLGYEVFNYFQLTK